MNTFNINTPVSRFIAAFKTLPAYLELQKDMNESDEVFEKARKIFFGEHPEVPRPKPIQCLDLVIDPAGAYEIIIGRRMVVYEPYDEFADDLYDENVMAFEEAHWEDEPMRLQLLDFTDSVRGVLNLHLHDEDETWYIDIECVENNTVIPQDDQVKDLQDRFGFHDLDAELTELNRLHTPVEERPSYFYFALGKITKTNL